MRDVTIAVCITCRNPENPDATPRAGAVFAKQVAQAAEGTPFRVMPVKCLAMCKRPLAAAVLQKGSWTYAFTELDAEEGANTLIQAATLLQESKDGRLPPKPLRPPLVQKALSGRFPHFDYAGDEPQS